MTTLTLMVCPHDTANNPDRWYLFAQYLSQTLAVSLSFDLALDFADFRERLPQADLVYANPADSLTLLDQGFVSLARPANLYDEVVFIANHDSVNPSIHTIQGQEIASVTTMLATKVGLRFLKRQGVQPVRVLHRDSWLGVIGSVWRGEAPFGIVYKDTFNELSDQGKCMCVHVATSDERMMFHSIVAGRKATEYQNSIGEVLLNMDTDEKGLAVLYELHIPQWLPVHPDEVETIRTLAKDG